MAQTTCPQCAGGFVPRRADQIYCRSECKQKARMRRQRALAAELRCSVDGCVTRPIAGLRSGMCSMHYRRVKRGGDVGPPGKVRGDRFGVTPCLIEGCVRKYYASGFCSLHYNRRRLKGDPGLAALLKAPDGAGTVALVGGYRRLQWYIDGKRYAVAEHRVIMEQILGRPLEAFENVHHKNGQRADNRPENLELWMKPQPCGQRPEDMIRWMIEHYRDLTIQILSEPEG